MRWYIQSTQYSACELINASVETQARLSFNLNEPEVLSSLLAGALASLPLSSNLCVWSHFHNVSKCCTTVISSIPLDVWVLNSDYMEFILKWMTPPWPPMLRLPSCIFYQRKEQLIGGGGLPICICLNHSTGWWLNWNPKHLLTLLPRVFTCTRWCLLNFTQTHCTHTPWYKVPKAE